MNNQAPPNAKIKAGAKMETTTEESTRFTPNWNKDGLITAIAVDHHNNDILMVAHMNQLALTQTLQSGNVVYWSRSRQCLWRKGETSGHTQRLIEMRTDCDQDAIILRVEQEGAACHTNRRSCFYRSIDLNKEGLEQDEQDENTMHARLVFTQ